MQFKQPLCVSYPTAGRATAQPNDRHQPIVNFPLHRALSGMSKNQGIVRDDRGQDQPANKERAQKTTKTSDAKTPAAKTPAAGPHSKRHLIDDDKTPGAGTLPKPG